MNLQVLRAVTALLFAAGLGGALVVEAPAQDAAPTVAPSVSSEGPADMAPASPQPTDGASTPGASSRSAATSSVKTASPVARSTEARQGDPPVERPRLSEPQRDPRSKMPLEVTVDPSCAKRKQRVTVTAKTRPYAMVAAAVSYSDFRGHGTYTLGGAGPTGDWVWTFVVPDKAPNGPGEVMVSAGDRSGPAEQQETTSNGESAAVRMPFNVSDKCP